MISFFLKSEGLGRVILEAQAVGCPVLVSDAGGMKDFIIDNDMEGTDEAKAILSLEQGQSTNVSTGQGWVQIRRNDNV